MSEHDQLTSEIVVAVQRRLGSENPEMARVVAEEVRVALESQANQGWVRAAQTMQAETNAPDRIVVTATGENSPGIVARLAAIIDEFRGDIHDINQTLVDRYFTMLIVVDITNATREGARFAQLRHRLQQAGQELGIHVVALHDEFFAIPDGVE